MSTPERRTGSRRESDRLNEAIVEQLLKLEQLPYGDSDGSEIRNLLARLTALNTTDRETDR